MLFALGWQREGGIDHLGDHGQDTGIGMVGVGAADAAAQGSVEAFEATGGAQVAAAPGWVVFLDHEVGDRGTKSRGAGCHRFRLGLAILLHDLEGPAQDGGTLLGLKDGDEIAVNGAALAFAFVGGEFLGHVNGLPAVAELVEQAALFGGIEVDGLQRATQAAAAIVNDQFQADFATHPLFFQLAQEGQPALGVLAVGQVPSQDFLSCGVRPHAQSDQQTALAAAFDRAQAAFGVGAILASGAQLREPDGVQLEDRRRGALVSPWGQGLELVQTLSRVRWPNTPM